MLRWLTFCLAQSLPILPSCTPYSSSYLAVFYLKDSDLDFSLLTHKQPGGSHVILNIKPLKCFHSDTIIQGSQPDASSLAGVTTVFRLWADGVNLNLHYQLFLEWLLPS